MSTTPLTKNTTANKTVKVEWTDASRVRMTARVDMPEYGIEKDQVFYLIRSSSNDGTYYIVKWSYERIAWQCSCPSRKPCRHEKKSADDCKGRINKTEKKEVAASEPTSSPQVAKIDEQETRVEIEQELDKIVAEAEKKDAPIQAPGLVQRPRVDAPRKESAFKKEFDALKLHRDAPQSHRKRSNQGFQLFR